MNTGRSNSLKSLLVFVPLVLVVLYIEHIRNHPKNGPVPQPAVQIAEVAPIPEPVQVQYPFPEWVHEGGILYLPAVVAFRVERGDLDRWAIPFSSLKCANTQFCVYGVDVCEPWRVEDVSVDSIRILSPAGPHFTASGPWDMAYKSRAKCNQKAGRMRPGKYLAVESHSTPYSLAAFDELGR